MSILLYHIQELHDLATHVFWNTQTNDIMRSKGVILLGGVSIKISIGNVQWPSISTFGGVLVKIGGGARIG